MLPQPLLVYRFGEKVHRLRLLRNQAIVGTTSASTTLSSASTTFPSYGIETHGRGYSDKTKHTYKHTSTSESHIIRYRADPESHTETGVTPPKRIIIKGSELTMKPLHEYINERVSFCLSRFH